MFRYLGCPYYNFLILISKMCFTGDYYFSNYAFVFKCVEKSFQNFQNIDKRTGYVEKDLSIEELQNSFESENIEKEEKLNEILLNTKDIPSYLDSLIDCLPYVILIKILTKLIIFRVIALVKFIMLRKYLK